MTQADPALVNAAAPQAQAAWHRFLDVVEPLRPDLYRYCRALTRDAWDAEDLAQDTLARAMVTLGSLFQDVKNPRAWLFRVASNLWIDRQRRRREVADTDAVAAASTPPAAPTTMETREAGATLIGRLSPQERAAVLLKDVFDFTIDEAADVLGTTPGAIKAALHRGRGKLTEPPAPPAAAVRSPVVDAFCAAFNARDIDALVALMLDTTTAEISGIATEYGPAKMRRSDTGSLHHSLYSPITHAVLPEWRQGDRGGTARAEVRDYRGEPVIVMWYDHDAGPVVRDVVRLDVDDGCVARIRYHFFSPEVIAEIAAELGCLWRSNGHRYWP
jgi:RNA polymerase sigma-70 factor (ECF subfamily)